MDVPQWGIFLNLLPAPIEKPKEPKGPPSSVAPLETERIVLITAQDADSGEWISWAQLEVNIRAGQEIDLGIVAGASPTPW